MFVVPYVDFRWLTAFQLLYLEAQTKVSEHYKLIWPSLTIHRCATVLLLPVTQYTNLSMNSQAPSQSCSHSATHTSLGCHLLLRTHGSLTYLLTILPHKSSNRHHHSPTRSGRVARLCYCTRPGAVSESLQCSSRRLRGGRLPCEIELALEYTYIKAHSHTKIYLYMYFYTQRSR